MYKLIGSKRSRAFRVLWALEEMGLDYELVDAAPRSDAVRALNPSGKIPAFLDGDQVLLDSVAIIQYLADRHGQLSYPAGTIERARQDSFMQFACDELDGTLWMAARHSFVLPEERRVPAVKETLRWEYRRSVAVLVERLGENEYLMGDVFTVADIVTAHCGAWARGAKFDSGSPAFEAYVERVTARPAYRRAQAA